MKRLLVCILTFSVFTAATVYAAPVQMRGSEQLGRFIADFDPIGAQSGFNIRSPSGYKLMGDFAGRLGQPRFGGVYLGGGLNYSAGEYGCYGYVYVGGAYYTDCGGDLQLTIFVMLTFEKLIPIPLVPFFKGGLAGEILFYNDYYNGTNVGNGGAFAFRVGGGVHYFLFKWLGLGLESNFSFGPGFFPQPVGGTFYGAWDFGIGARFSW